MKRIAGAGASHVGARGYHEDRWALAEGPWGAIAALADGISNPQGDGQRGASSAVAELACGAFVEEVCLALPQRGPQGALLAGYERAVRQAWSFAQRDPGGASFLGILFEPGGRIWSLKVGDCRAWGFFPKEGGWRDLGPDDDVGGDGGLSRWLGISPESLDTPEIRQASGCEALAMGSDGLYRCAGSERAFLERLLESHQGVQSSFERAQALVNYARRQGERDNITALFLQRSTQDTLAIWKSLLLFLLGVLLGGAMVWMLKGSAPLDPLPVQEQGSTQGKPDLERGSAPAPDRNVKLARLNQDEGLEFDLGKGLDLEQISTSAKGQLEQAEHRPSSDAKLLWWPRLALSLKLHCPASAQDQLQLAFVPEALEADLSVGALLKDWGQRCTQALNAQAVPLDELPGRWWRLKGASNNPRWGAALPCLSIIRPIGPESCLLHCDPQGGCRP